MGLSNQIWPTSVLLLRDPSFCPSPRARSPDRWARSGSPLRSHTPSPFCLCHEGPIVSRSVALPRRSSCCNYPARCGWERSCGRTFATPWTRPHPEINSWTLGFLPHNAYTNHLKSPPLATPSRAEFTSTTCDDLHGCSRIDIARTSLVNRGASSVRQEANQGRCAHELGCGAREFLVDAAESRPPLIHWGWRTSAA